MVLVVAAVLAGVLASGSSTPAEVANTRPDPPTLRSHSSVTVETFKADRTTLVSRRTYGPQTAGTVLRGDRIGVTPSSQRAYSSGKGGTTTSSGCRRVTVKNESETLLGFTAYWFNTWTSWCWNRTRQVVRDVTTGWYLKDVDSEYYWRGMVNREFDYYDYGTDDGHPVSAYKYYRQGRFENCVMKYGCLGALYPANTLRSYYNGTWVWKTEG